jgi:CRP-like cAMP-binding protein
MSTASPPITDFFEKYGIKNILQTEAFNKNEIILRPYEDTKYMYAITAGLVKVYTFDSRKKENVQIIYGPGDLFPLAWIIKQQRPSVYFQSLQDSDVVIIPRELLITLLKENNDFLMAFMKRIMEQLALFASTINNLGFKYGRERLCYRILLLASRYGLKENNVVKIPHISHSDLATSINMSRESVNREMIALEKKGIIECVRPFITILDAQRLQNEVGKDVPIMFFNNF